MKDNTEYKQGVECCNKGDLCPQGASPEFERGYQDAYAFAQMQDAITGGQ